MKVDKLTTNGQPNDWYNRITNECSYEYPIHLMDIKSGQLVMDIGCNVGGFVNAWKRILGDNIISIDASTYNVEEFKKNHPNNIVIHRAVGSTDGQVIKLMKFTNGNGDDTPSGNFGTIKFTNSNNDGWKDDEYEEVESISLETLIDEYDDIALMKIDVEGAEYEFLYGKDLSKIKYITMELHHFLGEKQQKLLDWISNTHKEIYTTGDGRNSHFSKAFERK
jgi:FkbM family methyltransferase